jgi:hypothetical protein
MIRLAFHSSIHSAIVHSLRNVHIPARAVWRALKRYWAGIAVITLLLLAGIAIKAARMAAANPAVAQALSHIARLLGFPGT